MGTVSSHQNMTFDQQRQWQNFDSAEQNNGSSGQEKGLGATVVGGAGVCIEQLGILKKKSNFCSLSQGAFLGHKVGKKTDHGTLGTIGGALAGAVVANMASNVVKGHHGGHGGHGSVRDRRRERLERKMERLG